MTDGTWLVIFGSIDTSALAHDVFIVFLALYTDEFDLNTEKIFLQTSGSLPVYQVVT